jgi:hypothetical protein
VTPAELVNNNEPTPPDDRDTVLRIARGVDSPEEQPAGPAAGSRSFALRMLVATLPKEPRA